MIALIMGVPVWYMHQYFLSRDSDAHISLSDPDANMPLLVATAANPEFKPHSMDFKTL